MSRSVPYLLHRGAAGAGAASMLREGTSTGPPKPRLLDHVRETLRLRHYSRRTEQAYAAWIRRYILFHGKRHPAELGPAELTAFLSSLAVEGHVVASTQNQALSALLFPYRDILGVDLEWLDNIVRAKRPQRLPIVLTRDEVLAVLRPLTGAPRLMAVVRGAKGDKDRTTVLPAVIKTDLMRHLSRIRDQHQHDSRSARDGWSCRAPSLASTPTPAENGSGSGSFPQPGSTAIARPARSGATTSTSRSFSARSGPRSTGPGSSSGRRRIPCDTRSPPISWKTVATSAQSRSFSVTEMSRRRRSTLTC
jgi:integrase-like protein